MSTMNEIRNIAELMYFFSGVVLAILAIFGVRQVKLLKKDIRLRNERASKEKALEFVQHYETYVEFDAKFSDECSSKRLPTYRGPIGDFTLTSIPKEFLPIAKKRFDGCWLDGMNRLELVAGAFVSGVADEALGFKMIGPSFCGTVASHYDLISLTRDADSANPLFGSANPLFQTIVDLYNLWAPRLSKAQLLRARDELEKQINATTDKKISPIGVDD